MNKFNNRPAFATITAHRPSSRAKIRPGFSAASAFPLEQFTGIV